MSEPLYLIQGCDDSTGSYPRLDVHDLAANHPYMWSLCIRAFNAIKADGYKPVPASFREIGYIHGRPYQRWSGDHEPKEDPTGRWGGYCYHASPFFPTWHRVLCLLIEQALHREAKKIAAEDALKAPMEKHLWESAADQLRLPWWDWTSPRVKHDGGLSKIFSDPQVSVKLPGGVTKPVENPLAYFNIEKTPSDFQDTPYNPANGSYGYFKTWTRTYRWPDNSNGTTNPVIEQYDLLDKALLVDSTDPETTGYASWQQLSQKVSQLFTFPLTVPDEYLSNAWDVFSNTGLQSGGAPMINVPFSLEDPHNIVHTDLGGYGHIADPDYAGIDPIFYLHHANVDRLLAYWEYVYENYWIRDGKTDSNHGYYDQTTKQFKPFEDLKGTYTEAIGVSIDEDSSLSPFRNKEGQYWTSRKLRFFYQDQDSVPKYYIYPPLKLHNGLVLNLQEKPDPSKTSALIRGLQDHFRIEPAAATAVKHHPLHAKFFQLRPTAVPTPPTHKSLPNFRQFFVVVELVEHAFKGSYLLQVFEKGQPQAVIAAVAVFARKDPSACDACVGRAQAGRKINGAVLIPHRIVARLLANAPFDAHSASDSEITQLLAASFGARLVTSGRDPIAETVHETGFSTELDDDITPGVTLVSAAVAVAAEEGAVQHEYFHDFESHGALSHTGWRRF